MFDQSRSRYFHENAGYSQDTYRVWGSVKKHIMKKKLGSMKSHDYHILLQHFLPVCLRHIMAKEPRLAIMSLSRIFRKLCVKVVDPQQIPALREDVVVTLCKLEVVFPPSFFDVMSHLIIHLVDEMDICGHVSCRWMYPFERYMKVLKGYVRNLAKPEGSMAEGYSIVEALGFTTEYMTKFTATTQRVWDANEEERVEGQVLEGTGKIRNLTEDLRDIAHDYVIHNSIITALWLQ